MMRMRRTRSNMSVTLHEYSEMDRVLPDYNQMQAMLRADLLEVIHLALPTRSGTVHAELWVDEDGKAKGLESNTGATAILRFGAPHLGDQTIQGNAILLIGQSTVSWRKAHSEKQDD
jgi:hypothetical protein